VLFGPSAAPTALADFAADLARRRGFAPTAPATVRARQVAACAVWMGGGDAEGSRVARLRLPVLVGAGKADPLLPVGNDIHLARTIRRAVYVDYPGAAHGFFIQQAADFVPRLLRFLR
jgi:pimeloyl-ACP methyl ester carboxylesterase